MIDRVVVVLAAYVSVLLQVGMLSAWPLFGGQPNLIAIGAAAFLMVNRPVLGLWWIVSGGILIDLLLPARFGITLLPLLVGYAACFTLLRWAIDIAAWWSTVLIGFVLLFVAELPLIFISGSSQQLPYDLLAGCIVLVPIGIILSYLLAPVRSGLRISRP
ncbi:MAG: hypothetical protein AAB701_00680 [Patescibacteria group bacterium]